MWQSLGLVNRMARSTRLVPVEGSHSYFSRTQ